VDGWHLLLEVVLLLAGAVVLGGVLSRLGQSPIVGYLLAGVILGSLGVVDADEDLELIAELGVALLLFSLGLEFSFARLRSLGTRSLLGGVLQVVLTLAAAAAAALALGFGVREAVAIGAMLCLSSTAAVLRILADTGEVDSLHGRGAVSILLVQDAAVVPLAVLLTFLTGAGGSAVLLDVGKTLLFATGFVLLLYLLIDKVIVRVLGVLTLERNREITVLLSVTVGLGSTWAAHAAGLSPALGAFIAGMILGSSSFAPQIRADVGPLRVVLLTLFFGAAGLVADPVWIVTNIGAVLGATALILLGKAALVAAILLALRRPLGVAIATGICLAQIGEFAFVLGSAALNIGVIAESTHMLVVSAAILSLFVTPWLVSAAPLVAAGIERWRGRRVGGGTGEEDSPGPEVLIVGFGPAGRAVGMALANRGPRVHVLDLNTAARTAAEAMCLTAHVGDAQKLEVLEHLGIRSTRLVAITIPGRRAALEVLRNVRRLAPQARIVVRCRHQIHAADFRRAGAHEVAGDEEEVGRELAALSVSLLEPE